MVSTGYNPLRVSAPRRIASLPEETEKHIKILLLACGLHNI
jgi:hypothetical protein